MICSVCLVAAAENDEIVSTTCGHCYHKTCIEKWLQKSNICPSCLRPTATSTLIKLFIEFSDDNSDDLEKKNEKLLEHVSYQDRKIKKLERRLASNCFNCRRSFKYIPGRSMLNRLFGLTSKKTTKV